MEILCVKDSTGGGSVPKRRGGGGGGGGSGACQVVVCMGGRGGCEALVKFIALLLFLTLHIGLRAVFKGQ